MRILQVANVRWFNATAWYALTLARLFQDAGHDCPVVVLPDTETHQTALDWGLDAVPLNLNTVNPLRLPGLCLRLNALLRKERFDVVDCHRGEAFVLFGLLKNRHGYSLIRTRGDQRPPKANLPNRWLHRRAADAVVATNSRTALQLDQAFGLGAERLRLILGGVDRRAFAFDPAGRERVRREFGYRDEETVFGLLGRFDEVKGQEQCIRAVARLARRGLPRVCCSSASRRPPRSPGCAAGSTSTRPATWCASRAAATTWPPASRPATWAWRPRCGPRPSPGPPWR